MAAMGRDQRQMMEDAVEDKLPEGLRVLAVDDDCVCLKVLEVLLRRCKYSPTTVMDAKTALKMLRAGKEQFDLVITDVRMPDMDGFKLLQLIGLEMDLPVIMISADCDKNAVMKGINHGACDYLMKPVRTNELKNIWQHVESRRRSQAISHMSDDDQRVHPGSLAKSKDSKIKSNDEDGSNENKESTHASTTQKKPRVAWTVELHNKFLEAINQIGLDKAAPNKILELMNVDYLTRHNIASHLQVNLTGIVQRGGTSHVPPRVNIPRINQLTSYETSSNGLLLQNQLPPFIGNNTSVASFNEQIVPFNIPTNPSSVEMLNVHNSTPMAPSHMVNGGSITTLQAGFNEKTSSFNIASNTSSIGTMLNGNSSLATASTSTTETNMVNYGRTISTLSNPQTDGFVALTPMPDGRDAAGILPVQESMVNQQEPNDLLNEINAFSSDDIANLLNNDFIGEDAVMDR